MQTESAPPIEPFFLIVADFAARRFCVEGTMTDDGPWQRAAFRAREMERRVGCGPKGPKRRDLSIHYQHETGFGGVPPGSILRPRE